MHHLEDMAAALGVTIERVPLLHRDGEYRHDLRLMGMTLRNERTILAHELAHAVFEDVTSKHGPVNAKQERRADEWVALRLINITDYRAAEEQWQGHIGAMAYDLGVISRLVVTYRSLLTRIGTPHYLQPRHSTGSWVHREEISA